MSDFPDLVEVVEQAECCGTVLIPINAHHGFSGSCQGVLQVVPPRIIIAVKPSACRCRHLIWYDHHQSFTNGTKGLRKINEVVFAKPQVCPRLFLTKFQQLTTLVASGSFVLMAFDSTKDQVIL